MKTEFTASQVRYEQSLKEMAYVRLIEHPELQAEAIAKHYTSHAMLALQILQLLDAHRHRPNSESLKLIDEFVDMIKSNHRRDFGISLEWKPES